jgi:hypothetical protein
MSGTICFAIGFAEIASIDGVNLRAEGSEKDAKLVQQLGQLQPFIAVFPEERLGQPNTFSLNTESIGPVIHVGVDIKVIHNH